MMPFSFGPAAAAVAAGGIGPSMNQPMFLAFSTNFWLVAAAVGAGIVLAALGMRVIRRIPKMRGAIASPAGHAKVPSKAPAGTLMAGA